MTKEIDALILIGHSNRITADVPSYAFEDAGIGLQYVQEGKTTWYNGAPITESDRTNLYASDIFLHLGHLAASVLKKEPSGFIANSNTFKFKTIDSLYDISPYKSSPSLTLPIGLSPFHVLRGKTGIPMMFEAAVAQKPSIAKELMSKWVISEQVHAERGTIELPGYAIDEILEGIDSVNMDEVAPTDITGSSYELKDIIDHTIAKTKLVDFPYYQTFKERENAVEMLDASLEDLKKLAEAIK